MTHRYLLPIVALLSLLPTARAVEPSELKPGLIATYPDGDGKDGLVRVEPTVALALGPNESAHPRLPATFKGDIHWQGYVNIVRPGKYRFFATVVGGELSVSVNGKLAVQNNTKAQTNDEVHLEGGVQKLVVLFSRTAPATERVQVELSWQGPGFVREPLAHQFLGHLPKERPDRFMKDVELERGRFAFEELSCAKCHKPAATDKMAKGLVDHPGPNLTDVAKRSHAGWIDAWLADPAKLRPHTTMPKLFAADAAGKAERYAVTRYLLSLANGPLEPVKAPTASNDYRASMEKGRILFTVTGCAACHTEPQAKKPKDDEDEKEPLKPEDYVYSAGTTGPAARYNLGAVGSKFRPDTLAAFLLNPLKSHPGGRMPQMNLSPAEALDLARYLCRTTDEAIDPGLPTAMGLKPATIAAQVFEAARANAAESFAFDHLPADSQWLDLGRKLVVAKGCVNCHAIEPGGKALTPTAKFPSLEDAKKAGAGKGCLDLKPLAASHPVYNLDKPTSAALTAFLTDGLKGAGSPAPTHAARLSLRRFNCLNCHSKDGEGGITLELADQMRLMEKAENADDIRPPLLTSIGHKSRTSWLKSVLTQSGRARPWMQLRMPQYGEANVGGLPEALALLEGTLPDDKGHAVSLTPEKIAAGKAIIGKGGLGCISCHDIAGVPNTGTRGPDLATINQRVRFDWYSRWLHQPLRMAPGTRMPQAFVDNKSTLATVFNGDPAKQAEAMWAYLSLGPNLPLPEGLEPPKGLLIAVKDRPELLRTFMPDAGTKAIAVGYPGGVSLAFSADQCRLSYAWMGNFLDASPVWNGRGGYPAKLLGQKFWTAPPGHPWGLTANPKLPPDFVARANHPAFGMPFPTSDPPRVYDGPTVVQFDGYSTDAAGRPTFRYTLTENAKGAVLKVAETPVPMRASVAAGLIRKFEVEAPGGYQTWLLAAAGTKEPRAISTDGRAIELDLTAAEITAPAAGKLILPDADRATVVELVGAPKDTQWRLVKVSGGWLAVVRLPESKTPYKAAFTLNVWALPKDDDALLKGLAAE